jgi:hypothetical protein
MKRDVEAAIKHHEFFTYNPACSVCGSNCCYVYLSILWNILFLFPSTSDLQFAVANKKAEVAQEKNTVECGGSSLAVQREFFYKIIKIRLSLPIRERNIQLSQLNKKCFL